MAAGTEVLQRYLGAIDAQDLGEVRGCLAPGTEVVAPAVDLHGEDQVVGWIQVFLRATDKPFAFDYVHVARLDGNRIASDHIYFDQLGFLSQLGLLPG